MTIVTFGSTSSRQKLSGILGDGNTVANYQPGIGVTGTLNVSAWANQIGAAPSQAQATGGNQPINLPFIGAKYAYLPAVASNTLTTPTKTVTGSFTISFDVALNDYTPAADVTLLDKSSAVDGFIVKWLTTDKIRLVIGDGATATNVDVVAASGFSDGTRHTFSIAWADGVGATFSYDGVQSGNQVAAAKTLTNVATNLTLGSTTSIGKIYSCSISGLYGFKASDWSETTANGATQVSSTTGETWTLNNTGAKLAQIVGSPQILFDGVAHYMATGAFTLNQPTTIYLVGKQVTWTGTDNFFDGATANVMLLNQRTSTPTIALYAGGFAALNTGLVLNTTGVVTAIFNGASSSLRVDSNAATTGNPGAANPGGFTLGSEATPASYGNIQVKEIVIRSVADSVATQAQIRALLKAIHGTP